MGTALDVVGELERDPGGRRHGPGVDLREVVVHLDHELLAGSEPHRYTLGESRRTGTGRPRDWHALHPHTLAGGSVARPTGLFGRLLVEGCHGIRVRRRTAAARGIDVEHEHVMDHPRIAGDDPNPVMY